MGISSSGSTDTCLQVPLSLLPASLSATLNADGKSRLGAPQVLSGARAKCFVGAPENSQMDGQGRILSRIYCEAQENTLSRLRKRASCPRVGASVWPGHDNNPEQLVNLEGLSR